MKNRLRPALSMALVAALALWYVGANAFIFPNYLAYFNELIGGPRNGYLWLVDSNLDWGQDRGEEGPAGGPGVGHAGPLGTGQRGRVGRHGSSLSSISVTEVRLGGARPGLGSRLPGGSGGHSASGSRGAR